MNFIAELLKEGKRITSRFGYRPGGHSGNAVYRAGHHRGIDLGGYGCGEAFAFPFPVVVTAARTSGMGTWGNTLCVSPEADPNHTILIAHLQSISAKVGQRHEAWQEVAKIGGTTHTGVRYDCHPHIEVQTHDNNWTPSAPWRGTPIDPETYNVSLEPEKPSTKFKHGDTIRQTLTTSSVWVRSKPNGPTVGQVPPGRTAAVLNHTDNGLKAGGYHWWYIQTPDTQGWVAENFFEVTGDLVITDKNRDQIIGDLVSDVSNLYAFLNLRR